MGKQIKPSVTNPTIAKVYQDITAGTLVLRPDFQRKFVWTTEHQEEFIDTILNGFPFPEIYICTGDVDVKEMKTSHKVIDGQQRLTTIKNYIEGKIQKPFYHIPTYKELNEEEQKAFLSYEIVVRDIGEVEEDTIKEIFRRINLTKFKLEDVEIHNAIYDGYFIKTAKEVLDTIELEQFGVFRESEFTRMADLHFLLLVMSTLENDGYFAQDNEVENKVAAYNDEYPNQEVIRDNLISTFQIIKDLDLPNDSIWFRKSNFFTLVVEIALHIRNAELPKKLKSLLLKLEKNIIDNKLKTKSEFSSYYSYMYQATHSRKARVTRASFVRKYVLGTE